MYPAREIEMVRKLPATRVEVPRLWRQRGCGRPSWSTAACLSGARGISPVLRLAGICALTGGTAMLYRCLIGAILLIALARPSGDARASDSAKYPDWTGQWERFVVGGLGGQPSHDQTKPWGFGQQAPLTPEYQAVLAASIADQAKGGLGNFPTTLGRAAGMPKMMTGFGPLE